MSQTPSEKWTSVDGPVTSLANKMMDGVETAADRFVSSHSLIEDSVITWHDCLCSTTCNTVLCDSERV
jgi:hypothetical protein